MGSRLLEPLTSIIPLPIDQLNFLVCELFSIWFGVIFRTKMSPKTTSPFHRHLVQIFVGLALSYFCFGYQVLHIVAQSSMCYALIFYAPKQQSHILVFVVGMGYVCIAHMVRQYHDYGGYTLDVTGPLMITTQKVTSLAMALYDGRCVPEEKLNDDQKSQKIKEVPHPVTFYSYIFCFHGIMAGPLAFFSEYQEFINGSNYDKPNPSRVSNGAVEDAKPPCPMGAVKEKCLMALVFGVFMVVTPMVFPVEYMNTDEFLYESTFIYRMLYMLVAVSLVRCKYYTAFKLGEAVNNAAGLGFSGYDSNGEPKWDLLNNANIWTLETCTSMKINIDSWNIRTLIWLRRVVYDRIPHAFGTPAVFLCSALWHGFYPGYYLTFMSTALVILAGREIRRNIRPLFQGSENSKQIYDVLTFIGTRFLNVYLAAPFCLLELVSSLRLYWSLFFHPHVISIGVLVYYTFINPPKREKREKAQ